MQLHGDWDLFFQKTLSDVDALKLLCPYICLEICKIQYTMGEAMLKNPSFMTFKEFLFSSIEINEGEEESHLRIKHRT